MTLSQLESSQRAGQEHLQTNSANKDNNRVPAVPLNSHEMVYGKEEHWLPSYIVDQLYLEMCEKDIKDSQGKYGQNICKYFLEAAKYAGSISAGDFSNTSGPTFELDSKDFSPRLNAELVDLYKTDKELLEVKEAVFRIFKARHRMIFYQYIEGCHFKWRFI